MKLQILGTGCPKCKKLEANAREAVRELAVDAEVVKIEKIDEIMNFGVMLTPALAIDDEVKSVGRVLTKEQIITIIKGGE